MSDSAGIVLLLLFIVVVTLLSWRRVSDLRNDLDMSAAKAMPRAERKRISHLVREQRVIADPQDRRSAEVLARAGMRSLAFTELAYRWPHLIGPVVFVVAGVVFGRSELVFIGVGFIVVISLGRYSVSRSRNRLQRAAEVNGWDLNRANDDRGVST